MKTSDFFYDLPQELIAQEPLGSRSESRMMILDRANHKWCHGQFRNIIDYLAPGDTLVFNDTKVSPVRLFGHRQDKTEKIEVLLLRELEPKRWMVLAKPGRKLSHGTKIVFSSRLSGTVVDILPEGERVIDLDYIGSLYEILDEIGHVPLPPYIMHDLDDRERYQTIYAKNRGSAAAPTAGLHFTDEIMGELVDKGINMAYLTLHIGLGTFRPVKEECIEDHHMHEEWYELDETNADIINDTKRRGNKVVAIGTTSARTLETIASSGNLQAQKGNTNIFIYPGYQFKAIDALLTNFHLPESTLLMMIAAFCGREFVLSAYRDAVKEQYRFFSLGDCMLIL